MQYTSPRRTRPGFTMIEMLVVFVLFAGVVVIAVRSLGTTLGRDRLGKAANVFGADIELAFSTAARQRVPVVIRVDSLTRAYALMDATDTTVKFRNRSFASGDNEVGFLRFSPWKLQVMPSGLATSTFSAEFGVVSAGVTYKKTLTMTRSGLVKIQ